MQGFGPPAAQGFGQAPEGAQPGAAPGVASGQAQPGAPAQHPPAAGWGAAQPAQPGAAGWGAAPPAQPGQPGWNVVQETAPAPARAAHEMPEAVAATRLGGSTGQAYLAMFSRRPIPKARLVAAGMFAAGALAGIVELLLMIFLGKYFWAGMLVMFCSFVPGAWLMIRGDEPGPATGLVPQINRVGLIASFVIGLVLAFASSTLLVWVVGIEHL